MPGVDEEVQALYAKRLALLTEAINGGWQVRRSFHDLLADVVEVRQQARALGVTLHDPT